MQGYAPKAIGIHGTILGAGDEGYYAIVRVGTMANGSPNQGWALDATWYPGGTIPAPSVIDSTDEPQNYQLYFPKVER